MPCPRPWQLFGMIIHASEETWEKEAAVMAAAMACPLRDTSEATVGPGSCATECPRMTKPGARHAVSAYGTLTFCPDLPHYI